MPESMFWAPDRIICSNETPDLSCYPLNLLNSSGVTNLETNDFVPAGQTTGPVNYSGSVKWGPAYTVSSFIGSDFSSILTPPPPNAFSASIIALTPLYIS